MRATHSDRGGRPEADTIMALVAISLAIFVMALDFTALSVALPKLQKDLNADVVTIQWIINAYAIVIGVLIVTGGRMADMFGRRRVFLISSLFFGGFSLLAGIAQEAGMLIAARAAMGIGGAIMWPAALGMTYAVLPKSKAGLAGGLIIGVAGLGNAFGPMLGGALTDLLSWRWVFLINVPVTALTCLVIYRKIKKDQRDLNSANVGIDYLGITTLSASLVSLLLALTQVTERGWDDTRIIGLLVISVVMMTTFVFLQRRAGEKALVPIDVLTNFRFSSACLAVLLTSSVFFTALIYVPLFMVNLLGFTPLKSGVALLPWLAVLGGISFIAGALYKRVGAKPIVMIGALCLAVGPFLLSLVNASSGYLALLPGMIVLGVGCGLFFSSATTAAVTALDSSRASLASGILYMFQVVGGSIGLGVATTVFSSTALSHSKTLASTHGLSPNQLETLQAVLTGKKPLALLDRSLSGLFAESFSAGTQLVYLVVAGLAFVGFMIAALFVGGRLRFARKLNAQTSIETTPLVENELVRAAEKQAA